MLRSKWQDESGGAERAMEQKDIVKLNELLVSVYDDIEEIETKSLRSGAFKDLSITEIHTIEAIGLTGQKSMSEIAADLNITTGTLTTAIDKLIKKEYVIRNRSDVDRRIVYIALTKKGKLAYRIHESFHYKMVRSVITDLTEDEVQALIKGLNSLNTYLKKVSVQIDKKAGEDSHE